MDFEPLAASLEWLIVSGTRAAELALRFKYAGFDQAAIEVVPDLGGALDRGLELTPEGKSSCSYRPTRRCWVCSRF